MFQPSARLLRVRSSLLSRQSLVVQRTYAKSFRAATETAHKRTPFWKISVGVALAGGIFYSWNTIKTEKARDIRIVSSDASAANLYDVDVENSVSPFPHELSAPLSTDFKLVAYGTRMVTFLNFKVYALGIYIAEADLPLIPKVCTPELLASLNSDASKTNSQKMAAILLDPAHSNDLTEKLLDAGIRFAVRIVPVRNTDFNHLRDGLVKSILAHPAVKKSNDVVSEGLGQLRAIFGARKGSVPKNHVLLIERLATGALKVQYQKRIAGEAGKADTFENLEMGQVLEPSVGKFLMLQYLSPTKPLSKDTRDRAIEKFSRLV